jgi:hypothetical protein
MLLTVLLVRIVSERHGLSYRRRSLIVKRARNTRAFFGKASVVWYKSEHGGIHIRQIIEDVPWLISC